MRRFNFILVILLAVPFLAFGYSEETTHPALTDEIVDLFNLYYPNHKISDEEKGLVKNGSMDEDKDPRWMHHFYDPVHERGLWGFSSSKIWSEDTLAQGGLLNRPLAGTLQSYFGAGDDHSWERAIYEYVWGDKSRGLADLGHILHLIEDASVPDHTRNDPHPHFLGDVFNVASPYEMWTGQFDSEKIEGLTKSLYGASRIPIAFSDLQGYFNSMAEYSNNNFFSKDTIFNKDYKQPTIFEKRKEMLSDGQVRQFGYGLVMGEKIKLVLVEPRELGGTEVAYSIKDLDRLILSDYWRLLSKQAVLHGAGVVKLFFDEVEKEKKTKVLYEKNKSWFARVFDATKDKIFGIAGVLYGTSVDSDTLEDLNDSGDSRGAVSTNLVAKPPSAPENVESSVSNNLDVGHLSTVQTPSSTSGVGTSLTPDVFPGVVPVSLSDGRGFSPAPGFGGGGSAPAPAPATPAPSTEAPPPAPAPSPSPDPDPIPDPVPPAGDTISPDAPTLTVSECDNSLSSDGCLVANANLSIAWSSSASDLASFSIECSVSGGALALSEVEGCANFSFASTTATSTPYSLPVDDATYTFSATAKDIAGNTSTASTKTVSVATRPVVINEIAWAGTAANSADEWIELKNRTDKTINLSMWRLYSVTDEKPDISLSGTIAPNGYYLIERTDDNTVSDITADLTIAFGSGGGAGLSNNREILALTYASTTIDETVLCDNRWCGGAAGGVRPSLERIDPDASGSDESNWGTSNTFITRGKDADGVALTATPRSRNSLNYLISQTSSLASSKTLKKILSPYVVPPNQTLNVNSGATLTVEPGVVVKMGNSSELKVFGTIVATGTATDNIVFTSFSDDSYGGDIAGDGSINSPQAGDWKGVRMESGSANSVFDYVRFRYGGKYSMLTDLAYRSTVSVIESIASFTRSIFEYSNIVGLRLTTSNSTVTENTFSVGTTTVNDALYVNGGSPTIAQNTFSSNYQGIVLEGGTADIRDNIFTDTIMYPVYAINSISTYSGNSGSGNGKNGIVLTGAIASAGATTTLYQNSLPYITFATLGNMQVPAGAGVIVQPGVVIQGESANSAIDIFGTIRIDGTSKASVLLTSLGDAPTNAWKGLVVNSSGYLYGGGFTLRYGGGTNCTIGDPYGVFSTCAGIRINEGHATIDNIRIEKNYGSGVRVVAGSATTTITNAEIADHIDPASSATGLSLYAAAVSLDNISFSGNVVGIYSDISSISVTTPNSITFSNNTATTTPPGLLSY